MKEITRIQCSISGFQGDAVTVTGAFDPDTGVAVVSKAFPYADERRENFTVVTNIQGASVWDAMFSEDNLRDAIDAYFDAKARGHMVLGKEVARHDPSMKIEPDGVDERGRKYRLARDIQNGSIAVLAMAWFAGEQRRIAATLEGYAELEEALLPFSVGF